MAVTAFLFPFNSVNNVLYRGCTAICIGNYTIDITSDNNTTATTSTNNNSNQSAAGNV